MLYDRNGKLLGAQVAPDGQWRLPEDKVNEKFALALIEAEDHRFRYHLGVDPVAIARAAYQNIRSGRVVSGGSTITMQTIRLARNSSGSSRRSILEKCVEAVLAFRLELGKSKDAILALYAANAPFGANVVGLRPRRGAGSAGVPRSFPGQRLPLWPFCPTVPASSIRAATGKL